MLIALSLVCLAGAAYLGYKTFFESGGSERGLQAAEKSYKRGEEALANNPQEAALRFDEAVIAAEKGLNAYAGETKDKKADAEQVKTEGKLNWALAKALRDRAFAKSKQDSKPIEEAIDTTSGQKYRSFYAIPDQNDRSKALICLYKASELLPNEPELLTDASRAALSSQPLNWVLVERLMKETVKANAKDSRANYFLAKLEFEQPQTDNGQWIPRATDKKDKDRVDEALKYLQHAEESKAPYWRTAHLKAEILSHQLAGMKDQTSRTAVAKSDDLDKMLFAPGGALDKAVRGEEMTALSMYDGTGLVAVHIIAMQRATAGTAPDKSEKVKRVVANAVSVVGLLAESKAGTGFVPLAGDATLDLLLEAKRALKPLDADWWKKVTGEAETLFAKYPAAVSQPGAVGKRTQLAADATAAMKVLSDGIEAARKAKTPPDQMSVLLTELANMKLLANAPTAEVAPIIDELRGVNAKQTSGRVNYLEGVLAERQGKLANARLHYNKVFEDKEVRPDSALAFITHLRLGPVCLAVGQPSAAVGHLAVVADKMKAGGFSAEEKAWLEQSTINADEVISLQAVAAIRVGLEGIALAARSRPGEPVSGDLKKRTEDNASRFIKTINPQTSAERSARLALAEFELAVRDRDTADKYLAALVADYPSDVTVLRTSVARILMPEEGKKEPDAAAVGRADIRIDQFLKANPDSRPGKLFKAEWLIRTRRPDEAVAFLNKPENFPDQDDVVKRMLGGALLQAGNREEAKKVLGQLPQDLGIELAIIRAAGNKEEMEKGLKSALSKFENNGLLRLYDGLLKMNDGKFEEAAREFRAAGEFTSVSSSASALLQRALIAYAGADRKKAIAFIHSLIAETPDQPGLYQAAALAAKYTDDIGQPSDQWEQKKTMYAAANKWAVLSLAAAQPPEVVGMVKVAYHELAGAPLLARQDAVRVLAVKPKHAPALIYLAQSHLFGPNPDLTEAKKYITTANEEAKADNPAPSLLEGVWLERSGKDDDAAKLYERMMTQYAGNPAPYARRIELAAKAKKPGEAVSWARKWVEKMPADVGAMTELVRRLSEAGEDDTATKTADDWSKEQLDKAKAELTAVKPPLAADEVAKRLAAARAGINLATARGFFRANKFAEAKKRVDEVLKDDPASAAALMMAGDIAMSTKDWDTAERVYGERLKKAPDDFIAANNLAWVLSEHKNNPKKALELLDVARLSGNDTPVAAERLPADFLDTYGRVYLKLNDKAQWDAMVKLFEPAVRRYSDDPRLHRLLGEGYAAQGVNSKALVSLTRAIELAGDPAVVSVPEDQKTEAKKAAEAAKLKLGGK